MSQQTRLEALSQAIGADIKAARAKPDRLAEELAQGIIWSGHRGGPARYPENGLRGLRASAEAGFLVETDVRATSDGKLVIMHDASAARTSDLTTMISASTYAQVRKGLLDAPNPGMSQEPIPDWQEVLDMAHETNSIFIPEIKDGQATTRDKMIADLKARGMEKQAIPCSFTLADCVAFAQAGFQASYITSDPATNWQSVWDQGVRWCSIEIALFTTAQVTAIKNIGFKVLGWTIQSWQDGQNAIAKGVHGCICDDPWLASERQNPRSTMLLDGSLPSHWAIRDTSTDVTTIKDVSGVGFRWSGDNILQRRGSTANVPAQAIDLGFVPKTLPIMRMTGRFLPGASAQDRWFGLGWTAQPNPDTVMTDSAAAPGQVGYTFIYRRTGELAVYYKDGTTSTQIGTTGAPTPNVTTTVTQSTGWMDLEVRVTPTQIIAENTTTGQSVTIANTAYRGAGRLFLINRGTDFETDLSSLAFASTG